MLNSPEQDVVCLYKEPSANKLMSNEILVHCSLLHRVIKLGISLHADNQIILAAKGLSHQLATD